MKNLTKNEIIIQQADGSRLRLPAAVEVPTLTHQPDELIGHLHDTDIYLRGSVKVDFGGITLNAEDQPYIVERDIFEALPANSPAFITPHLGSAIRDTFRVVHAYTGFIAKDCVRDSIKNESTSIPSPVTNN